MSDTRIEKDSLGEMEVPAEAYYGAQTERARRNFPISGLRCPAVHRGDGADQGGGGAGQRGAGLVPGGDRRGHPAGGRRR